MKNSLPNGVVLWQGASILTGSEIVAIATGLLEHSRNEKTGPMVQTWILSADYNPIDSIYRGADDSVCGDCPLRGRVVEGHLRGRACYVNVGQAPLAVWQGWQRGLYPVYNPAEHDRLLRGRRIRFGAYGDPTAVPFRVWSRLARLSSGWTGYTHQWADSRHWRFRRLLMASVESVDAAQRAHSMGWHTFRVKGPDDPYMLGEFHCPASTERGHKTTCARCCQCKGCGGIGNVVINGHGSRPVLANMLSIIGQ